MDYSKKRLENPFHKTHHRIKRDELSLRLKLSCLLFLFLLVVILYLMFFSTIFNIKKIQITGLSRANASEVEGMVWQQSEDSRYWLFKQNNLLIFDKDVLIGSLIDKYHFKEVEVKRGLFQTLKINLTEREYYYIWQEKDKYYYLDKDSYLIDELVINLPPVLINSEVASSTNTTSSTTIPVVPIDYFKLTIGEAKNISGNKYPIIVNTGEERFSGDKVDIDPVYLEFVDQLQNSIKTNNESDLSVKYFIIDKDFNTIKAMLDNGLLIYFSTKEDRDSQIKNLLVLKRELKSDFNKIIKKKIDLRYGDKVYYE